MKSEQNDMIEIIDIKITRRFIKEDEELSEDQSSREKKHYTDFISYLDIKRSSHMGDNIQNLRRCEGWTLDDLSKATGVSVSTLNKYENMIEGNVCKLTLKKVAEALEVSFIELINEIFYEDGSKEIPF